MTEIVARRYKGMVEEGDTLPQLVLIDGGKGQLSAALKAIDEVGLRGKLTIASIAKKLEEIYLPGDPLPLYLDKKSESLKLLQRLRNEAHRFAITFHRQKRSKAAIQTSLTDIPGIGEKTATMLLKHFGSVKKLREASSEELTSLVGKKKSADLLDHLNKVGDQ
jgi:excinuclease ABC subunit C